MEQNKYEDPEFFANYSKMPRSADRHRDRRACVRFSEPVAVKCAYTLCQVRLAWN